MFGVGVKRHNKKQIGVGVKRHNKKQKTKKTNWSWSEKTQQKTKNKKNKLHTKT
jgi:hypothetical protein